MINFFLWSFCLVFMLLVIFRFWKEWRLDYCRYELFKLRDELFFYGIDNKILDTPDYRNAERYINIAINSAEKLSSSYFITVLILMESGRIQPKRVEHENVLGSEKRKKLKEFKEDCLDIVIDYIQQFSLIMLAVSLIYSISHFIKIRNAQTGKKRREEARKQKREIFGNAFICSEESLATNPV